jgi:hypothetical protein
MEAPKSDEVLDRHKFYAVVAERFNTMLVAQTAGESTRSRIHQRVDDVEELTKHNTSKLAEIDTQKNTVRAAIGIAWLVFGGIGGWAFDKTSSKLDLYIETIEKQKKEIETLTRDVNSMQGLGERVDALTRVTTAQAADINAIKYRDSK